MSSQTKYKIQRSGLFKKSFKKCVRRGCNISDFQKVIEILANEGKLPKEYLPHELKGQYKNVWECHINPDWLLLWEQNDYELTLLLVDTGTHSDLFGKKRK